MIRAVPPPLPAPAPALADEAVLERRFGGLRRLYGEAGYARLRAMSAAVVGLGGVGSWAAEALARCGVARLVLIDLDQVAESNINRQVQAVGRSVGQAKTDALAERLLDIHPGCEITRVEDFVTPENWPSLLPTPVDALVDACDQVRAKAALAAWARATGTAFVCAGAAGGKQRPERIEIADLADTTHDPLLASLRARLRREQGAPRQGPIGVRCVFSREAVARPADAACEPGAGPTAPGAPLACAGYGSSVMVTASVGLAAAADAVAQHLARRPTTGA